MHLIINLLIIITYTNTIHVSIPVGYQSYYFTVPFIPTTKYDQQFSYVPISIQCVYHFYHTHLTICTKYRKIPKITIYLILLVMLLVFFYLLLMFIQIIRITNNDLISTLFQLLDVLQPSIMFHHHLVIPVLLLLDDPF